MSEFRAALAVAILAAATAARAQAPVGGDGDGPGAQADGGFNQGATHPLLVLLAPAVQTELKLDDDQKGKAFEAAREATRRSRAAMQAAFQNGGGQPQAVYETMLRLRGEADRAVAKALKPDQQKRFDQILLQVEGPVAVARPEVAARLKLRPSQSEEVQGVLMRLIVAQQMAARRAAAGGFNADPAAVAGGPPPETANLRATAAGQINRLLTTAQRDEIKAMLGEPFDLAKIDPALAPRAAPADGPAPAASARARRKRGAPAKAGDPKAKAKTGGDGEKPGVGL